MRFGLVAVGLISAVGSVTLGASLFEVAPPQLDNGALAKLERDVAVENDGARLFEKETFGGNGRTCSTCHRKEDRFSTTPSSAQRRFAANPADLLFRPTDSDAGAGNQYTRLLAHASIRVEIPLKCPNIWLEDDPTATSVVLNRGIPELENVSLDPVLMSDGRASDREQQARGAVHDHFGSTVDPDMKDLHRITEYQASDDFFSSDALRNFAAGGPPPELPAGNTAQEIRGREDFLPAGLCGRCHSGPMLNTTTAASILGAGHRFNNIFAGELVPDQRINPPLKWHVIQANGTHRVFNDFADPGRMLITCNREDLTRFKIRSLWNVKNTAPYFHDNSAKTLEDVIAHYKQVFIKRSSPGPGGVSDDRLADILAYLRLL